MFISVVSVQDVPFQDSTTAVTGGVVPPIHKADVEVPAPPDRDWETLQDLT